MVNECVIARTINNKAGTSTTPTYKKAFLQLYRSWMTSLQSSTFGNNLSTLQRDHPCHSNCSKIYVPLKVQYTFSFSAFITKTITLTLIYLDESATQVTAILCNYRITKIITSSKKGSQINHPQSVNGVKFIFSCLDRSHLYSVSLFLFWFSCLASTVATCYFSSFNASCTPCPDSDFFE